MTWFQDFSNCDYFGKDLEEKLLVVGWLSEKEEFPKGIVDALDLQLIIKFCSEPFLIHVFRGFHQCELCKKKETINKPNPSGVKLFGKQINTQGDEDENERIFKSRSHLNIFIPYENKIIVFPENLPHYIKEHGYKPPDNFFAALYNSPKPGSKELSNMLIKIGGKSFDPT